jgi:hypothetical protein
MNGAQLPRLQDVYSRAMSGPPANNNLYAQVGTAYPCAMETVHNIAYFTIAVLKHWQSWVTGSVVTGLIAVFERLTGKSLSKRAYGAIFVVAFLLVAFFLAWQDEYQRANNLESKLRAKPSNTTFQVNVPPPTVIQQQPAPAAVVPASISSIAKELPMPTFASHGFPTTETYITAHGTIQNPVFEVTCDKECVYETAMSMSTGTLADPKQISPTKIQVHFVIPAQLTDGQQVFIRVRSTDQGAIHSLKVRRVER